MANKKISELPELAETPAADDFVAIVDTDASATKKIKPVNLHGGYVTDGELTTHESDTSTHGVSEVDGVTERDSAISTHSADTTAVHGIADTSALALTTDLDTHAADTSTHGASDIADVSDIAVDGNLSANAQNAVTNRHAESHTVVSHNDTTATGANLNTLVGSGETALHSHAEKGTTDDHAGISANDAATDVTGAQLEELSDGSTTTLHNHADQGTTDDYSDISANDGATDVTGAELEELTDGSTTTKHNHVTLNVVIDAIPDADNTAEGIKATLVAGESIDFPQVCYQNADSEIHLADADGSGTYPAFCMALESKGNAEDVIVLMQGFVRDDDWTWTMGAIIYLSDTPGGLTETAPSTDGDMIQVLGIATATDRIWFSPNLMLIEHS